MLKSEIVVDFLEITFFCLKYKWLILQINWPGLYYAVLSEAFEI